MSQDLVIKKLEASHVLEVSSRPLYNIHMIPLASDKKTRQIIGIDMENYKT
jgi:hypothetical protein